MGAESFSIRAKGRTAAEAFKAAVAQAQYDYGHSGYTGTIAEKDSFIMLPTPADIGTYYDYDPEDPNWQKVDDKWGPAGCFDLGDGWFLFFGWVSS